MQINIFEIEIFLSKMAMFAIQVYLLWKFYSISGINYFGLPKFVSNDIEEKFKCVTTRIYMYMF